MPALTLIPTATAATTVTTANTLSTTGGTETSKTTKTGKLLAWGVLFSQGNTGTWPALASEPAYGDVHGFIWDVTTLEGQTLAAGTWTAKIKISASSGAISGSVHFLVGKRSSGGVFTNLGDLSATVTSLGSTGTVFTCTGSLGSMDFAIGDKLYVNIYLDITSNTSSSTTATTSLFELSATNESIVTPGYTATPLVASQGVFNVTGGAANFSITTAPLVAAKGVFNLTGGAALLKTSISAAKGSFTLLKPGDYGFGFYGHDPYGTGTPLTQATVAAKGAFTLTGHDATLSLGGGGPTVVTSSDSAALTESALIAVVGSEQDALTDTARLDMVSADAGSLTNAASISLPVSDSAAETDSALLTLPATDSYSQSSIAVVGLVNTDAAAVSETGLVGQAQADSSVLSDSAATSSTATASDAAAVTESVLINNQATDTATENEAAAAVAQASSVADAAALADTAVVGLVSSDTATQTNTQLTGLQGADSGVQTDIPALTTTLASSDAGSLTESAAVDTGSGTISKTGADSALLAEAITIALQSADAAALQAETPLINVTYSDSFITAELTLIGRQAVDAVTLFDSIGSILVQAADMLGLTEQASTSAVAAQLDSEAVSEFAQLLLTQLQTDAFILSELALVGSPNYNVLSGPTIVVTLPSATVSTTANDANLVVTGSSATHA